MVGDSQSPSQRVSYATPPLPGQSGALLLPPRRTETTVCVPRLLEPGTAAPTGTAQALITPSITFPLRLKWGQIAHQAVAVTFTDRFTSIQPPPCRRPCSLSSGAFTECHSRAKCSHGRRPVGRGGGRWASALGHMRGRQEQMCPQCLISGRPGALGLTWPNSCQPWDLGTQRMLVPCLTAFFCKTMFQTGGDIPLSFPSSGHIWSFAFNSRSLFGKGY